MKITREGKRWMTEPVWHNQEISMHMGSPVLDGHLLFGLSYKRKGQFFCLDARTGSTLWGTNGREGDSASTLSAGRVLCFLTTNAELVVATKTSKSFEQLARYSVAETPTWAHLVVLDKHFLVKDASSLVLWSIE